MKSLSEILENNREVAKELMCKNNKLHISFKNIKILILKYHLFYFPIKTENHTKQKSQMLL